jgi:hypothetical protein
LLERFHSSPPKRKTRDRRRRAKRDIKKSEKEKKRNARGVLLEDFSGTAWRLVFLSTRVKVLAGREGHHERRTSALAFLLLSVVELTS